VERGLWQLGALKMNVAHQRGFQGSKLMKWWLCSTSSMRPPKALDHAIGLRVHRRAEAVLDAEIIAKPVEIVLTGCRSLAQAEQPIGEFLTIIG